MALNGVKYHDKEPQHFFDRFSFICGALRLLCVICLCLMVAFPLVVGTCILNNFVYKILCLLF